MSSAVLLFWNTISVTIVLSLSSENSAIQPTFLCWALEEKGAVSAPMPNVPRNLRRLFILLPKSGPIMANRQGQQAKESQAPRRDGVMINHQMGASAR